MIWRAPNNARAMREADLGPVIGQIEPMQPLPKWTYDNSTPRWVAQGWQTFIGWCAVTAWFIVIMVWLWLAFIVLATTSKAAEICPAGAVIKLLGYMPPPGTEIVVPRSMVGQYSYRQRIKAQVCAKLYGLTWRIDEAR